MNTDAIRASFAKMNLEQMREVNRLAIERINSLHRERQATVMRKFTHGDLVEFTSDKQARVVRLRVERLNQKSLSGVEVDSAHPRAQPGLQWRVSPSLCRLLGEHAAVAALGMPEGMRVTPAPALGTPGVGIW